MKKSIYLSIYLSFYLSISLNGQVIHSNEIEKGTSIQRNASFNTDEIKVRWKKAALENCSGVPCTFICGTSTVTDVDGNVYNTKLIGSSQCWTTTNLKVTKYNDGSVIPDLTGSTSNPWATSGARTEYVLTGVTGYVGTFGYLYNWYAVNDLRKLCPAGWHVPSDGEWTTLTTYLGGASVAGGKMKSIGTAHWNSPNTNATNESGFSVLPGGYRSSNGSFNNIRTNAFFWSATVAGDFNAWDRSLGFSNGVVTRSDDSKSGGASVRCLRD